MSSERSTETPTRTSRPTPRLRRCRASLLVLEDHRGLVRGPRSLQGERLVDAEGVLEGDLRVVPRAEHSVPLGVGEERELGEELRGRRLRPRGERLET
jgi:hypothetical protein